MVVKMATFDKLEDLVHAIPKLYEVGRKQGEKDAINKVEERTEEIKNSVIQPLESIIDESGVLE